MNKVRKEILDEWTEHPFLQFGEHPDLKAMCVCSGYVGDDDEVDFDEVVFAVPKEWLFKTVKMVFEIDNVQYWLENEYTSDDSHIVFQLAMDENQICLLEFNSGDKTM